MNTDTTAPVWRPSIGSLVLIALTAALLGYLGRDATVYMFKLWEQPEYNYGYMIPAITAFLIWQKRDFLQKEQFDGSWFGVALIVAGLVLFMLGNLAAVFSVVQYALVMVIAGLVLAYAGRRAFRYLWMAVIILLFMVPLPGFIQQTLSNELQLISSRIGVAVIRMFGISVFLEGNVIDLGTMQLQVVEACSGLRYLFPLMTLGFIVAHFYSAPFWKRAVVFLSTIPITVLMNSFRIGVIGVLVEYGGREQAEGFLHDFEGWIIFMACTFILVLEMLLLTRLGRDNRSLREVFGIDLPAPTPKGVPVRHHRASVPFVTGFILILSMSLASWLMPPRVDTIPARSAFSKFPTQLQEWRGEQERMEMIVLDSLNLDDYLMANFTKSNQEFINLYVGYYETQRADKVPHSPRACLPGGGWSITSFERREINSGTPEIGPIAVNRAIIEMGESKQLMYYWFKQRDRYISEEYTVKWFIFWDALRRKRSDGALVRLITPVKPGEDIQAADHVLENFAKAALPALREYVPD